MAVITSGKGTQQPLRSGLAARKWRRGSELIEFTLVLFPLLAFMTVLADISWPVIAKAALQRAVREGVRQGVTLTASQMSTGSCLTDTVKAVVQNNSMGLLNGSTGLGYIQVNYFAVPNPGSSASTTNVSGQSTADTSGNIMQVSVVNLPVQPLMPVIGLGNIVPSSIAVTVFSSDLIEPDNNPPCVGSAP